MNDSRTPRDAYWHCASCGNHKLADESDILGALGPCTQCGGTAQVMTLKEGARIESEIARGIRPPRSG